MKKLILSIFFIAIFFGCDEKHDNITDSKNKKVGILIDTTNPYNNIGEIHNTLLADHFDKMHPHPYDCMDHFIDTINSTQYQKLNWRDTLFAHMKEYIDDNYTVPQSDLDSAENQLDRILRGGNILQTINGKDVITPIVGKFVTTLDALKDENFISTFEYNELLPIFVKADLEDYEAADSLVSEIDITEYDNDSDDDAILRFKAIYEHSFEFWHDHFGLTPTSKEIKSSTIQVPAGVETFGIVLADGLFGALGGVTMNPVGVAFGIAAGSGLAAHQFEMIEDILNDGRSCCCGTSCPC